MRAVHLSDLHIAACALRGLPEADRAAAMKQALVQAQAADLYRSRFDRAHPSFGTGTLASTFGPVAEPPRCDAAYLAALAVVVGTLRDC